MRLPVLSLVVLPLALCDAAKRDRYLDASLPVWERVADLLPRLTLEECISQVASRDGGMTAQEIVSHYGSTGLGAVTIVAVTKNTLNETVAARNALQAAMLNSRLGIPVSFYQEGLHSGSAFGTIFPMPLTTASSWNDSLPQLIGSYMATEAREAGVDNHWSPVVNMWSDARFGRFQEGFSPDPTITAHMGTAITVGLQGGASSPDDYLPNYVTSVAATAKHFVGYGQASGGLNGGPNALTNRTLFEIFLRPWRALAAVGVRGFMPSHETVLDIPVHANEWLIDGVFRNEFGAGNATAVSDCNDIGALAYYGVGGWGINNDSLTQATALGVLAGVDLDLQCGTANTSFTYFSHIPDAIAAGFIAESQLRVLAGRVLTRKFASGLFDAPLTPPSMEIRDSGDALALEAAEQGVVLLQNNGSLLPLTVKPTPRIAVIGPLVVCELSATQDSSGWFAQYGTSYGPLQTPSDRLGCYGRQAQLGPYTLDSGSASVPLLPDALAAALPGANITVAAGATIDNSRSDLLPAALAAAAASDVAIVVLGDDLHSCGEWEDRDSLDLPGSQLELLAALVNGTTTPIVLVLIHGRTASFGPSNALLAAIPAVLEAGRPGQAGATAIVEIITGAVNPSGKLVTPWVQNVGQIGSGAAPFRARIAGKWLMNARGPPDPTDGREYAPYISTAYSSQPLFRLGHGLSYTTFAYRSLAVSIVNNSAASFALPAQGGASLSGRGRSGYIAALAPVLSANVTLCNTGAVPGVEVVQVYSQDPRGLSTSRLAIVPFWKRLVAYGRLALAAGACDSLVLPVSADDLALYDDSMSLRILPGQYIISAGGRSDQDTLQQIVNL